MLSQVAATLMRSGFSISIVAMTDDRVNVTEQVYDWNMEEKGHLLGSWSYGFVAGNLLSGVLSKFVSARNLIVFAFGAESVLLGFTPIFASLGVWPLFAQRVLMGLVEGPSHLAMMVFWQNWAPKTERSLLLGGALTSGYFLGMTILGPFLAFLCASIGWQTSFYIPAALGLLWTAAWFICSAHEPEQHRWISKSESAHIIANLPSVAKLNNNLEVPWKKIITSLPIAAYALLFFGLDFHYYLMHAEMPTYLD